MPFDKNEVNTDDVKNNPNEEAKKSKKGLVVGLICGGVILAVVITVVICVFVLGNDKDDSTDGAPSSTYGDTILTSTAPAATETVFTDSAPVVTPDPFLDYIEDAKALLDEKKYTEALALMDTAEQLLGSDERISKLRFDIEKAQLLDQISNFESEENYKEALLLIDGSKENLKTDADVLKKYNAIKITYKNNVISTADSQYKSGKYDDAIKTLADSLSVLKNDSDISQKIKHYTPTDVSKLTTNNKNGVIFGDSTDPRENVYNNAMIFYAECSFLQIDNGYRFDAPSIELYTGGEYSDFIATIVPEKDFDKYGIGAGGVIKVYADNRLVYTSKNITRKTEGITINADISNAKYIKIAIEHTLGTQSYQNIYNTLIVDGKVYR